MSLRQVLSIYNAERQLNEDDTALLNTLRRFTDSERALFVEQLSDKPQKKPGKGRTGKTGGKSPRASGMAAAISNSLESSRKATGGAGCFATVDDNGGEMTCGKPEDDPVHDTTYLTSHPFVRDARRAASPSSPNNADDSSTASSATEKGAAGNVAQGASGGD